MRDVSVLRPPRCGQSYQSIASALLEMTAPCDEPSRATRQMQVWATSCAPAKVTDRPSGLKRGTKPDISLGVHGSSGVRIVQSLPWVRTVSRPPAVGRVTTFQLPGLTSVKSTFPSLDGLPDPR